MGSLVMALDQENTSATSFDALYRATSADLYAYVTSIVGDRPTAEDVTMLAFERAYRRRGSFDARRGSRRGWLFGIARNAALDELRRRRRSAPLLAEAELEAPAPADEDDPIRRLAVRGALAGLDARERELVALRFVAGLSHAEIAQVLGTTPANAGTRLHRVVTKLREACHVPA